MKEGRRLAGWTQKKGRKNVIELPIQWISVNRDEVMLRFSWTVADGAAAENLSDRPEENLCSHMKIPHIGRSAKPGLAVVIG